MYKTCGCEIHTVFSLSILHIYEKKMTIPKETTRESYEIGTYLFLICIK